MKTLLLEKHVTMINNITRVIESLSEHADLEANPTDTSPDDAIAHRNGLCIKELYEVLADIEESAPFCLCDFTRLYSKGTKFSVLYDDKIKQGTAVIIVNPKDCKV